MFTDFKAYFSDNFKYQKCLNVKKLTVGKYWHFQFFACYSLAPEHNIKIILLKIKLLPIVYFVCVLALSFYIVNDGMDF